MAAERIDNIPQPFKELVREVIVLLELGNPGSVGGPIGGYANLSALVPVFDVVGVFGLIPRQRK